MVDLSIFVYIYSNLTINHLFLLYRNLLFEILLLFLLSCMDHSQILRSIEPPSLVYNIRYLSQIELFLYFVKTCLLSLVSCLLSNSCFIWNKYLIIHFTLLNSSFVNSPYLIICLLRRKGCHRFLLLWTNRWQSLHNRIKFRSSLLPNSLL